MSKFGCNKSCFFSHHFDYKEGFPFDVTFFFFEKQNDTKWSLNKQKEK